MNKDLLAQEEALILASYQDIVSENSSEYVYSGDFFNVKTKEKPVDCKRLKKYLSSLDH